jgi:hypothetical protein
MNTYYGVPADRPFDFLGSNPEIAALRQTMMNWYWEWYYSGRK